MKNPEKLFKKWICPLCGQEAVESVHNESDWISVSCLNPNCLNPSTGWGTRKIMEAKWNNFSKTSKLELTLERLELK